MESHFDDQDSTAEARHRYFRIVAEIRSLPGFGTFLAEPSFQDITEASTAHQPLIYLVSTPHGTVSLVVEPAENGALGSVTPVYSDPTSSDIIALLLRFGPREGVLFAQSQLADQDMMVALDEAVNFLGDLLRPLHSELKRRGVDAAALVPCGPMGLLPLAAARLHGCGDAAEFLINSLAITIVPSAVALTACKERCRQYANSGDRIFVLGDPRREGQTRLPGADAEMKTICAIYGAKQIVSLSGAEATRERVLAEIRQATHVHLACHASSHLGDPTESRLYLNDGDLTVRDIDRQVNISPRLVALSACQSGHFDLFHNPEEVLGLPSAFIAAGAAGVIATLWPVDDSATCLLMSYFYERLREDGLSAANPSCALQAAQNWLRTLTIEQEKAYIRDRPALRAALANLSQEEEEHDSSVARYAEVIDWGSFIFVGQ